MKNLIWYWNLLHFNLYVWQKKIHSGFNYINPMVWISNLPFLKNFYSKHGVENINKYIDDEVFNDEKKGVNSIWAGIHMGTMFLLMEYGVFNLMQCIIGKPLIKYIWEDKVLILLFIILLLSIAGIFNYFVLFKDDKYLSYFREFEGISNNESRKYSLICFATLILILVFVIVSFAYVPNSN